MSFGKKLAQGRKEQGLTQKQLALQLNVSDKTISSWENERTYPDITMLIKISDTVNLTLDALLREDNDMVKEIDVAVSERKKYQKWKLIFIGFTIIICLFGALNGAWLLWRNHRFSIIQNYDWSAEVLPDNFSQGGYHIEKNGLQVILRDYQTPETTPYLHFDTKEIPVTVQDGTGSTLVITNKNTFSYYDGAGASIEFNELLEVTDGISKGEKMTATERNHFFNQNREQINRFKNTGLTIYNDLNP